MPARPTVAPPGCAGPGATSKQVDRISRRGDFLHKVGWRVFERILVVCVGNVCRSPTAACLLRHHLPERAAGIGSAGLVALAEQPIDPMAGEVLTAHGLVAPGHRARRVTRELLQASDLVLAMEKSHLARLRADAPEATGKIFLLDKWVDSRDVPDPYGRPREVFERVYAMIDQGVRAWLPHLH